jgi:hypothetical protein
VSTPDSVAQSPYRDQIIQAIQQGNSGNWPTALETVRAGADDGDIASCLVAVQAINSAGLPVDQAIPYVDTALRKGVPLPAMQMAGRIMSDPAQRENFLRYVDEVEEVFPAWDVLGWAPSIAATGDTETAARLVELLSVPRSRTRRDIEALQSQAESVLSTLQTAAATVEEDRTRASEAILNDAQEIAAERERVSRLVTDTTRLVHEVAADHIAEEYASRADSTLRAALWWTAGTLLFAAIAVGWGVYVGIHAATASASAESVIGKALVTVPLLAIAAYLGSIAASTRRMGWHWRHVELQIKTAEPFIAELDDETRKALQAALTIRFFPGQGQDPQQQGGTQTESLDLSTVIAEVFREMRGTRTPPVG